MLIQFITALQKTDLVMTAEEIADMLWLASHMDGAHNIAEAESISQSDDEMRVLEVDRSASAMQSASSLVESQIHPISHKSDTQSGTRGSPFRSPAASALPHPLLLARALRPLMRRLPSRTQFVLNEQATVQHIAEAQQKIWLPVLDPMPVRRFDIELVIDDGPSMFLWRQVMIEWYALLERQGAFRNVRMWRMTTNEPESVELYAGAKTTKEQYYSRNPKELIDPGGRRLILVMTDCISPAWHSGKVQAMLDIWGRKNLVSLIQVFPRRLWRQTALVNADSVQVDPLLSYISNYRLKLHGIAQQFYNDLSSNDKLAYPVVTLEARSLYNWSRMITGTERVWVPGVCFSDSEGESVDEEEAVSSHTPLFPMKRVQLFHANASSTARKLVGLLAATPIPIDMEVIRLIQHTMVPEADQVHIAEVLLSGLLEEIYRDPLEDNFKNIEYDFLAGVRDELLNTVAIPVAQQVFREISLFVEHRQGKTRDFPALIATSKEIDQDVFITNESRPFAQITSTILQRYGGDFVKTSQKREQPFPLPDIQPPEVKETVEAGSVEDRSEKRVNIPLYFPDVSETDIVDLAELLEERKNKGPRIAVILGSRAGALFRSQSFPEEMAPYSPRRSFSVDTNEIARFSECYDLLKRAKDEDAPGDLEKFLNEQIKNIGFSFADECLASLVKQKIFKMIISFNPDDIIYDALTEAELKRNEDFVEIDFDRFGRHTLEDIRNRTKRACSVIKLFNDVNAFVYSLDRPKIQEAVGLWVRNLLDEWRIKEVLLVGIDPTWDQIIFSALPTHLKTIWFVNEDEREKEFFYSHYEEIEQFRFVTGGKGEYEKFLQMLYWQINPGVPPHGYELTGQLTNQVNVMQSDMMRIKDDIKIIKSDQDTMLRHLTRIMQLLEEKEL